MTDDPKPVPGQEPAPQPLSPNLERMLRYLPIMTIAHFFIGLPALIASLALAYFAFVQADATQKMQTGGAMPFVSFGTSNVNDDGEPNIALSLTNNGVGPAILGPIEIVYDGKPVANPAELLSRCCGGDAVQRLSFATSPSSGIAIRPGEDVEFISLARNAQTEKIWQAFNRERWKLKVRSCYCSIFNDCWVIEGMQALPKQLKTCPANWSRYSENAGKRVTASN